MTREKPVVEISLTSNRVVVRGKLLRLSPQFFSLYCFLAAHRLENEERGGWVELDQIAELSLWERNDLLSIGKQIRRHLLASRRAGCSAVEFRQKINGPFRLAAPPKGIRSDASRGELLRFVGVASAEGEMPPAERQRLFTFVESCWKGRAAQDDGKLRIAARHFEAAATAATSEEQLALAHYNLSRTLERQGKHIEAAELLDRTVARLEESGVHSRFTRATLLAAAAFLRIRSDELTAAEKLYHQALLCVRGHEQPRLLGEIYNGLGLICGREQQYSEELRWYEKALREWVLAEYFYGVQAVYFNLGKVYSAWGDGLVAKGQLERAREPYQAAIQWLQCCISLCETMAIADDLSDDKILLAHVYRNLEQYDQAMRAAKEAFLSAVHSGNQRCIALSAKQLASAHALRQEFTDAEAAIRSCKERVEPKFLRYLDEAKIRKLFPLGFRPGTLAPLRS